MDELACRDYDFRDIRELGSLMVCYGCPESALCESYSESERSLSQASWGEQKNQPQMFAAGR